MRAILFLVLIVSPNIYGQTSTQLAKTDVVHYSCDIEADISRKTVQGRVTITFNIVSAGTRLSVDCGNLIIESVA